MCVCKKKDRAVFWLILEITSFKKQIKIFENTTYDIVVNPLTSQCDIWWHFPVLSRIPHKPWKFRVFFEWSQRYRSKYSERPRWNGQFFVVNNYSLGCVFSCFAALKFAWQLWRKKNCKQYENKFQVYCDWLQLLIFQWMMQKDIWILKSC